LYAAESATRAPLVRWLLADEVGLGKTVEACLILNHLLRTGRADRTLVVAPETLTVQWLGELWRKYHQVFVLLDDKRLADVEKDYGPGFNPFDAHRRVVLG
ncbi:MAG: RNA polymerase-associated protein RapA, partial [Acidobacteria bacterium]|nr:RNA polymerase-associated protein RapA [Acidobacteriota bacterium]NIM62613.1 RNA polymerase-associated protein RapA [Acidobacteriota bacterium]NIO60746.1 RNA polymerase-associated protein RapA [Acidobacteriota bacterium]NIQ31818.1 RNA polymerase-associated protein RapA [Acidobacteriota bacterium]NIQ87146.1 RNA polymerase-associated protein RapA [Acidobacteriota bacterium]